MTEEEQQIAIAEACGWKYLRIEADGGCYGWQSPRGGSLQNAPECFPRYTRSQDAIHEAKITLLNTPALVDAYAGFLGAITGGRSLDFGGGRMDTTTAILLANAAQQCEALLRAIGKWTVAHGINCKKVVHNEFGGYLHDADDDRPYLVDGYTYCGRCHHAI